MINGLFSLIGYCAAGIGHAIALPFLQVKSSSRLQQILRWAAHVACVLGVMAGLALISYMFRLDSLLLTPIPALRNAWLPLIFVQLYGISWLGWWLCQFLSAKPQSATYPDIDKAWRKVQTALNHANIEVEQTPLFLIVGKPAKSTASFLNAGQVVRTVPRTPDKEDAPFHIYAGKEGIYVCCEGTSLLGRQAEMFERAKRDARERSFQRPTGAGGLPLRPSQPVSIAQMPVDTDGQLEKETLDSSFAPTTTPTFSTANTNDGSVAVGSIAQAVLAMPETARNQSAVGQRALESVEANLALLDQVDQVTATEPQAVPTTYQAKAKLVFPLLQNESEIEETTARLSYLCSLIKKARRSYCTINGVLVLVPYCSSKSENVANHAGMLIEQDLQAISDATQVHAPRIAVFCDLEEANGCIDLLDRFPEQQRHRRLGIKFPRIPACDRQTMDQMIVDGINWLCTKLIPPVVNRLFQTERTSGGAEEAVNLSNQRLYNFMNSIRHRRANFERIIRRGFMGNRQPGELLRGCYFAATGRDAVSEQGFTAGIFSQVFELQNDVQWTDEAVRNDQDLRRWTMFGYASVATVSVVALLLILL